MTELLSIFLNVLTPVFLLVFLGYSIGPRLELDGRTLSRFAYYILTPAFIFNILSTARIEAELATRMTLFMVTVYSISALIAFLIARLFRRSAQMTAAFVMLAVFGNVGNFGLPIIQFAVGEDGLLPATVYFLANLVLAFVVCVTAANFGRSNLLKTFTQVLKTPALLALPPAILVNWLQFSLPMFSVPLFVARPIALLADALIPTMLIVLGVQLASAGIPRPNLDMLLAIGIRLISGPVLAFALVGIFGISGLERDVGILQASMPTAVLVSIIALENKLLPEFITATVLLSNVLSIVSLALVIALL
jgi:hypothetical protein